MTMPMISSLISGIPRMGFFLTEVNVLAIRFSMFPESLVFFSMMNFFLPLAVHFKIELVLVLSKSMISQELQFSS